MEGTEHHQYIVLEDEDRGEEGAEGKKRKKGFGSDAYQQLRYETMLPFRLRYSVENLPYFFFFRPTQSE